MKILVDREYRREIEEVKRTKDWNAVRKKEYEHHFELKLISLVNRQVIYFHAASKYSKNRRKAGEVR
jgi:hypothetical protein